MGENGDGVTVKTGHRGWGTGQVGENGDGVTVKTGHRG